MKENELVTRQELAAKYGISTNSLKKIISQFKDELEKIKTPGTVKLNPKQVALLEAKANLGK